MWNFVVTTYERLAVDNAPYRLACESYCAWNNTKARQEDIH